MSLSGALDRLLIKVIPILSRLAMIVSVLLSVVTVVINFDSRFRNSCSDLKLRLRSALLFISVVKPLFS